jgi:hypothetical protein
LARIVQFLIENIYDYLHDTGEPSSWDTIEVRKSEKEAIRLFYVECKGNGHSDYCTKFKADMPVPQEHHIIIFLQQYQRDGRSTLPDEFSRSVKTEKWRDVYSRWMSHTILQNSLADSTKGPTPVLTALWRAFGEHGSR